MNKFLKNYLLYLAPLLACFNCVAQTKTPFRLFFEKVYLHTDRDLYEAGEDIWFKAYLVNAQNNTPINTSGNLYVELISPQANIIGTETIRLDDGVGIGDFKLQDSIPPGKYRIRAYTSWMRNFGNNFIFEKNITVLDNAIKSEPDYVTAKPETAVISFFPEGGPLLDDVSSQIAVKVTNQYGKGMAATGELVASSGRSLTKFTCDSLGFGLFTLVPDETQTYTTNVMVKGIKYTADLPLANKIGFALGVNMVDTTIAVAINCSNPTLTEYGGHNFVVYARHGGKTYFKDQVKISSTAQLLQIPTRNFPDGIAEITLYDDRSRALNERLVYVYHPERKVKLSITTNKPSYAAKEFVAVKLKVSNTSSLPEKANLSMAVVDGGVVPVEADDISSYLLLKSEVKGEIEQPKRYFDTTNVNRVKQMDLLLMTQGWRDFVWKRLLDTTLHISYLAEDGYTVSGKVRRLMINKPIPAVNITLSAPKSKGTKLFSTRTDSLGRFFFDGVQAFGLGPIRLTARDDKGNGIGWIIIDTARKAQLPIVPWLNYANPVAVRTSSVVSEFEKRQVLAKKISLRDTVNLKEIKINGNKNGNVVLRDQVATSFGYPDEVLTVTPKDLTYNTVGDYILHASNQAHASNSDDNGIYFLSDGKMVQPRIVANGKEVPFTDADPPEMRRDYYSTYFGISMDKVEKVVIKHLLSPQITDLGQVESTNVNGIAVTSGATVNPIAPIFVVYLTLKPGALDRKDFNVMEDEIDGYYTARTFYSPIYNTGANLAKSDVRTTIHWEPLIKTNASGEALINYYNADPKNKVRIVVQGLTDKGVPIAGTLLYNIK